MITVTNRKISFLLVAFVYAVAILAGVLAYGALGTLPLWAALLIADAVATVAVFLFSLLFGNASVYDPYWSVQPPVILLLLAASFGKPLSWAGVLILVAVFCWAIRLTANWAYTFRGLTHQDWRYTMLHEKTGRAYPLINLLGIHMFPTLVVYACILPAVYALRDGGEGGLLTVLGVLLSLLATTLQLVSDMEMQAFRRRNEGGFIRTGLWHYARHPNYLGEILMWWGIAIASISLLKHEMWVLVLGAIANTVMFLVVSIPMADRRQARKEGYAAYRAETRHLLPIPRRGGSGRWED